MGLGNLLKKVTGHSHEQTGAQPESVTAAGGATTPAAGAPAGAPAMAPGAGVDTGAGAGALASPIMANTNTNTVMPPGGTLGETPADRNFESATETLPGANPGTRPIEAAEPFQYFGGGHRPTAI